MLRPCCLHSLPVTKNANKDLSHNDPANFEIVNGINPCFVANSGTAAPTSLERCLEEGLDVSDGEQDISRLLSVSKLEALLERLLTLLDPIQHLVSRHS